jgi:hypothetical protein
VSDVEQPHEPTCTCALCGRGVEGLWHDLAFQLPDRVFALSPEEQATRTWRSAETNADFVVLDEASFYVRGILPVPLPGGDEFRYGAWLEVTPADFTAVLQAWDDDAAYARLRFRAALANALPPYGDRALGAQVDVATGDVSARPKVVGAEDGWLATLLRDGWDQATYEAFARTIPSR